MGFGVHQIRGKVGIIPADLVVRQLSTLVFEYGNNPKHMSSRHGPGASLGCELGRT